MSLNGRSESGKTHIIKRFQCAVWTRLYGTQTVLFKLRFHLTPTVSFCSIPSVKETPFGPGERQQLSCSCNAGFCPGRSLAWRHGPVLSSLGQGPKGSPCGLSSPEMQPWFFTLGKYYINFAKLKDNSGVPLGQCLPRRKEAISGGKKPLCRNNISLKYIGK